MLYLFTLLATILFFTKCNNNANENKKTLKPLVKELLEKYNFNQYNWIKNLKINKDLDGIMIGSDVAYVQFADDKDVELYMETEDPQIIRLNTNDASKVIEMINNLIKNDNNISTYAKKNLVKLIGKIEKYRDYYFLNKYLKYKQKYLTISKK